MKLDSFLLSVGAVGVLRMFYRALRTQWPLAYFAPGSSVDPIVRRSMWRYLAFRTGPVFLTVTFVAVTVKRWGDDPLYAVPIVVFGHVLTTVGWALMRAIVAGNLGLRVTFFWSVSAALAVIAGAVAYLTSDLFRDLVPEPGEMSAALWTGTFASAVAVWTVKSMAVEPEESQKLLDQSASEIPRELVEHAKRVCDEHNADEGLVLAVMVVENLQ